MQRIGLWLFYIVVGAWTVLGIRGASLASHRKTAFQRIEDINSRYGIYKDNGNIYQIDMKLPRRRTQQTGAGRNDYDAAIRGDDTNLWLNGIIPYTVSYHIKRNTKKFKILKNAMKEWEEKTCIKFVERTNQVDYVEFYHGEGCNSDVGRVGGRQTTSLGGGCAHHSIIVHELGHVIGFWHEQNRPDRDKHVEILWDNIIPKFQFAFTKYSNRKINSLGVPYDYYSVMHYGSKAFSKNHKATIRSHKTEVTEFGNTHISQLDAEQANLLYKCPDYPHFPQDFYWKTDGPGPAGSVCVRFYEPRDRYNWRRNYLCYRKDMMSLDIKFSHNGPMHGMQCLQISTPTKAGNQDVWYDNFMCWPQYGIYKFTWLTRKPTQSEMPKCLNITNPTDPDWSRGQYFLCASKDQAPVDGKWSVWSPWKTCSRPCGGGLQTRTRTCANPPPSSGGKFCTGDTLERRRCNQQQCEEWPSFPADFSYGYKRFVRPNEVCLRTYERYEYFQWTNFVFCSPNNKRDPEFHWSDMGPIPNMRCTRIYVPKEVAKRKGSWDDNYLCMKNNGSPYRFQFSYNGPVPGLDCMQWYAKGGKDGWDTTFLCNQRNDMKLTHVPKVARPINGQWSSWGAWQACSKSCGGGAQRRLRKCDNPAPSNGGRTCRGRDLDERACNIKRCPVACGTILMANGGRFTSPDFPHNYPDNSDCIWLIKVPRGKIISLKFNYFDVEGPVCSYDWLEIHDGPTVKYPLLGKLCGSTIPSPIRSTGNYLWIKFKTDDRTSHKGFDITWTSLMDPTAKRIPRCGGQVTRPGGSLTSPGYPKAYPGNVDCTWVITGTRDKRLHVWFDHFDVDQTHDCSSDYVQIRDGRSALDTSLGRYCGTRAPVPFKSHSDSIRLTLHSDGQTQRRGFRIRWRSIELSSHATQAPTPAPNACPVGWESHSFGNIVYCYLVKSNYHTWFEARRECIQSGDSKHNADLLSVLSKEEENFIIKDFNVKHNLAESFMWMGLNDRLREGEWAWSDRTRQSYINWAPGDPNDGGYKKNEDCGVLKPDGKWNDYPCDSRFRYICKSQAV